MRLGLGFGRGSGLVGGVPLGEGWGLGGGKGSLAAYRSAKACLKSELVSRRR